MGKKRKNLTRRKCETWYARKKKEQQTIMKEPLEVSTATEFPCEEAVVSQRDFIVSPSSGILRERTFNSASIEKNLSKIIDDQEDLNRSTSSESSFASVRGVLRSSTPVKNQDISAQMQHTSTSSTFIVSEMSVLSGIVLCDQNGEFDRTVDSIDNVRIKIQSNLPACWDVTSNPQSLILRKNSLPDLTGPVQRSIVVNENGVVTLQMHFKPIRSNHVIWHQLPDRVSFNANSGPDFAAYVLKVVDVFRLFDVCMGNPEPELSHVAKKMSGAVYDENIFAEARYRTTYRSHDCDLILPVQKKFCPACSQLRKAIKLRQMRAATFKGSPHPKTKNNCLNTPQTKRKLFKLGKSKKNADRKVKYYKDKMKVLLMKQGVLVDKELHEDLKFILKGSEGKAKLSTMQKIFLREQLKAASVKGKSGMRWHPLLIRLALQVHMVSPAAYDALCGTGIIQLPSRRTLFDYSHHSKSEEGISIAAITEILKDIQEYPEGHHKRYFVLLMDEMSISNNLVYSRATGELKGFVDLSEVDKEAQNFDREMSDVSDILGSQWDVGSAEAQVRREENKEIKDFGDVVPNISKTMLCFMAVGITQSISQVVASFGVKEPKTYQLSSMMWSVVTRMEANHAYVLGLVCDGHPTNRKFIQSHVPITKLPNNLVFDTKNRAFPLRPFYFISDPPHLLKTIRNCFYVSDWSKKTRVLKKGGEIISWQKSIVRLYKDERYNELRLAHKLNAQVVYLNSYSAMKVSYAARVLSNTVANALELMYPNEMPVTVDFIRKVNRFFDCLNGASLMQAVHTRNKDFKSYQTADDQRFDYLSSFREYVSTWAKTEGAVSERHCLSHQTIDGIEMTCRAFPECVKFMLKQGAPYVMARAFCQDPLEQFFGKQRAACGGSTNPNKDRFLNTQMKILNLKSLRMRRSKGNTKFRCALSEDDVARLCAPLRKRQRADLAKKRMEKIKQSLASHVQLQQPKS